VKRSLLPAFGLLAAAAGFGHTAEPGKPVIAIAPVGDAPLPVLAALLPALRETFGCETVAAPVVALPASAYDSRRRQHLSTVMLDALAAARRPEWERLLGVVDVDLYVPDLNFVFGEADSRRGVAVFSLARLRDADQTLFEKRARTEAVHELGHAYGLGHCSNPRCVMWFSNTLAESDRKGSRFCVKHASELARRPSPRS
jgi:archaemetzincin